MPIRADRVRALRRTRRVSQGQLADIIGISRKTFTLWENGKADLPLYGVEPLKAWIGLDGTPEAESQLACEAIAKACYELGDSIADPLIPLAQRRKLLRSVLVEINSLVIGLDSTQKGD